MNIIYWWLCEVEPSPKISKKKNKVKKLIQEQTWWNMLTWNPRSTLLRFGLINNLSFCIIKHSICSIKCICIQIKLAKLNYFPNLCKKGFSVANTRDILIHLYSYTCSMCLVLRGNVTHYKLWDNIKDENLDELQWPEQQLTLCIKLYECSTARSCHQPHSPTNSSPHTNPCSCSG